jgi:integrase/recombinase XerD
MNGRIKLLFWLYKSKVNRKGEAPIYARLSQHNKKLELSLGISISPRFWDSRKNRAKGSIPNGNDINDHIEAFQTRFLRLKSSYLIQGIEPSIYDLKSVLQAVQEEKGIMEYFQDHNERIELLVGKDYSSSTLKLYCRTRLQFQGYLRHSLKCLDMPLSKLDYSIIQGFADYLKVQKNNTTNTVLKKVDRVNRVINHLIQKGVIRTNPFAGFKIRKENKEIVYLTSTELTRIEDKHFELHRLAVIKDLFLFSCYTGLAYKEVHNLQKDHICIDDNQVSWIMINRQKTDRRQEIPLLARAIAIIDKYVQHGATRLLPCPSNQKLNAYLKEIADLCGITKRLTFHVARKTFATTVTLSQGVSMETVSKLLGHSNIAMTSAFYAVVNREKMMKEFFGKVGE